MAEERKGYLRLNHFHGLRLESTDFQVGETYHLEKKRLHNRVFHGFGVVSGYSPSGDGGGLRVIGRRRGDMSLEITPGYAIDGEGNDVFLWETEVKNIDPSKFRLPQTAYIVLKYVDEPTEFTVNAANPKYKGHRRVLEASKIEIITNEPDPEEGIEIARVELTDEVTEITDARDPMDPQPGEIDLRYVARAGVCGSSLDTEVLFRLREQLAMLRREFGILGTKFRLHSARDIRDVVVSAQFVAVLNLVATLRDVITLFQLIADFEEEVLNEFQDMYPDLTDTREYQGFKENVHGLLHLLKTPKYSMDELNSLLGFQMKAIENAHGLGEMEVPEISTEIPPELLARLNTLEFDVEELKKRPAPKKKVVVDEETGEEEEVVEDEEEEEAPKPKGEKADPDARSLTWDELQELSGDLPEKIFMDGKNYRRNDIVELVNRKNEKEHNFTMEEYKDKWSTNQTYKYPDGTKITSKGQAHVGGYSQWDFQNVEPGKDLIIAKRIDYAYSGLVTAIYADGEKVGDWKIEGQDRKNRWRNWLFRIPGEFVKRDVVTIKQECVDAEREVNMFKLWCFQAVK